MHYELWANTVFSHLECTFTFTFELQELLKGGLLDGDWWPIVWETLAYRVVTGDTLVFSLESYLLQFHANLELVCWMIDVLSELLVDCVVSFKVWDEIVKTKEFRIYDLSIKSRTTRSPINQLINKLASY